MPRKNSEVVTFEAVLLHETELAYFLEIDGEKVWLPKSQVEWDSSDQTVQVPRWLADEKELT